MKLLIVGSALEGAIEKYYEKYIKEYNFEVKLYDVHGEFIRYYTKHIANKILFRLGFSTIYKRLNESLICLVREYQPTHIWVFKGMEIYPQTLQHFRQQGVKLINYNPDNPFIFTGRGSGNVNVTKSIGLYDLHFTYSQDIQKELEIKFQAKTAYLPFGFDISTALYERVLHKQEIIKVCFLGNPDKQRAHFLNQLAVKGVQIDIYGNNWANFVSHPNFTIHDSVWGEDFWKVLYQYRIQLNIMRIHNEDAHNMRTFEIAGIGGIQLAPRTKEHELFFEEMKEIFLYDNLEDCIQTIKHVLSMNFSETLKIRQQARQRCIRDHYSYEERVKVALDALSN